MTGQQENEVDLKIKQNQSAVTILNDILHKYEKEMVDSQSSLSVAIYEYFSIHDIARQKNTLYEQYLITANTWKKLMEYGIARQEFHVIFLLPCHIINNLLKNLTCAFIMAIQTAAA